MISKFFKTRYIIYKISKLYKSIFFILPLFLFFSYQQFYNNISIISTIFILRDSRFCINILIDIIILLLFLILEINFEKTLKLAKSIKMYYFKNHLYIKYHITCFFY